MPILSAITAIPKRYPDIAVDPDKHLFERKLSILIGIFSLVASRSHRICFVAALSRWRTTASWPDALHLRQHRLVNNPGQLIICLSILYNINIYILKVRAWWIKPLHKNQSIAGLMNQTPTINQAPTLTINHWIYFKSAGLMNQAPPFPAIISVYPPFSSGFLSNH